MASSITPKSTKSISNGHHPPPAVEGALAKLGAAGVDLDALGAQVVTTLATQGRRGLEALSRTTGQLVERHPIATAGTLLGIGFVIGTLVQRAMRPKPSLGDALVETLARRADDATHVVTEKAKAGIADALRQIEQALNKIQ